MVEKTSVTNTVKKIILRFGEVLENQGVPVSKLIVFGSYAKNQTGKDSDIDVCVVSPKFGKDKISELQFLFKQSRHIDTRIEPYPVSPKDYRDIATPLIFEIKKFGIEIKGSSLNY